MTLLAVYRVIEFMQPAKQNPLSGTPASDLHIDKELVHSLLKDQHADLEHLPLHSNQEGWDNVTFRLGEEWAIRLPRRHAAATLIGNEQAWLPSLADRLPLAIPVPYRIGKPALGYPWRWSIVPWLPGVTADIEEPAAGQAVVFAAFLEALHTVAPINAPFNPVRGVPLHERAIIIEERIQRLEKTTTFITEKIRRQWNVSLHTPIDTEKTWIHGDLHARNVLVQDGRITGIIDWGDITSGDTATDLASLWMLFPDRRARENFRSAYTGISEATWQRARGWAILFGVILLDTGLINDARNAEMGRKTLQRVLEDD